MVEFLSLPDDFVTEAILSRLLVKSIMQCRSVCKSWNSLITSPSFISTHLLCSKTLTHKYPQIFIGQLCKIDRMGKCLLHFEKEDYFWSMSPRLPRIPYSPYSLMVGSVKGLICLSIAQSTANTVAKFILSNPSVGSFQVIRPPLMRNWEGKGLGFDERTQDYKIFLTIYKNSSYFIYSLNSNSWRSIVAPHTPDAWSSTHLNSVVFMNGRFHWLALGVRGNSDHFFIRVLDVESENFGEISLPECLSSNDRKWHFTEFGESSVAVIEQPSDRRYESNIWVMKEYGSDWIKLSTIYLWHDFNEAVLGFKNEDEVLIKRRNGWIASYKINNKLNLNLNEGKKVMHMDHRIPGKDFSVHKYVPSFVLLNKQNNVNVAAPTPCTKSVGHESPSAQKVARRRKRNKHRSAK